MSGLDELIGDDAMRVFEDGCKSACERFEDAERELERINALPQPDSAQIAAHLNAWAIRLGCGIDRLSAAMLRHAQAARTREDLAAIFEAVLAGVNAVASSIELSADAMEHRG